MFTNASIRSLAFFMLAALASPLITEMQSINQSARVGRPHPVEVIYAVAETLPRASSSYHCSVAQTKSLQNFFAKPRHHKALTDSKDTVIKHIVGILTRRQTTTTLLTFSEKDFLKSSLHLSFDFKEIIIGKKRIKCLKLTATSSKPLVAWQNEFVRSIVKTDSFFVRHPFLCASLGVLTAFTVAGTFASPAILRSQRKTDDVMEKFREAVIKVFKNLVNAYEGELFYENVPTRIANPFPSLGKAYDTSYPTFDASSFEIPSAAPIALIGIPGVGAISALVKSGKLNGNEDNAQVRLLIIPLSKVPLMVFEMRHYSSFFKQHNCLPIIINDTASDNPAACPDQRPIKLSEENLDFTAGMIVGTCTGLHNLKFNDPATDQPDIASCATGRIDAHVQEIRSNFTNPAYLVRYPTQNKRWNAIGNEATATTEVVILPVSSFLIWLLPKNAEGELSKETLDELTSQRKTHLDFCKVPLRQTHITKSIVCIINDIASPYILKGELTTPLIRLLCSKAETFRQDGCNKRFDDFFITLEPTSNLSTPNIHYIASEELGGHDSTLADEENDTNNTVKVFTPSAVTNTLRSSYQAAANYVERLLARREFSSSATSVIAGLEAFDEFDKDAATAETLRQHADNKAAIAWTALGSVVSDFKRFELDILAALRRLDPGIRKEVLRTSPSQDLLSITSSLTGPQVRDKYRLIFIARDQIGSISERKALNLSCADNGWQLVVFGKTSLTHNNNRFFVNMYDDTTRREDTTSRKYVVSTHLNTDPSQCTEYQDAVMKIAQTLKDNRLQMISDFREKRTWEYRDSSTTTAGAGAGSSASTPRRAEHAVAPIAEAISAEQEIVTLLDPDGSKTALVDNFGMSENVTYTETGIIFVTLNNINVKANTVFANKRLHENKKYVLFTTNTQQEISAFMDALGETPKSQIFVVSNYVEAKELGAQITLTQATGTSQVSLQEFKDILLSPISA